ncbi:MAG: hypothetical protein FJ358_04165 [Thaumarchaeota archaeon]|nr:hypothetical protein [Nitrososphaerota archaeon]
MIPDRAFSTILNPTSAKPELIKKIELQGRRQTFTVSASIPSKQQYDMIMQILEKIMKKEECDKGYAMVKVFSDYSKASGT